MWTTLQEKKKVKEERKTYKFIGGRYWAVHVQTRSIETNHETAELETQSKREVKEMKERDPGKNRWRLKKQPKKGGQESFEQSQTVTGTDRTLPSKRKKKIRPPCNHPSENRAARWTACSRGLKLLPAASPPTLKDLVFLPTPTPPQYSVIGFFFLVYFVFNMI